MRSYGKEKKLVFSYVYMASCFFFFAIIGFSIFNIFSQRIFSEIPTRRSVREETENSFNHEDVLNIPFQVLSWNPRAFYLPNFATKQQCEAIIDMVKPKLKPSMVASKRGKTVVTTQNYRTSTGVFMSADEDESGILTAIEEKIALATRIPRDHYERFNILRYQFGQKSDPHYDAFNPAEFDIQRSQRLVSFILYLSSLEEGGETMFPFESGRNMNGSYDYQKCLGLKVKPRQGDAMFFYNLFPNGTIDPKSLHGSCPIIKGEKWVAAKWINDQLWLKKYQKKMFLIRRMKRNIYKNLSKL